jgi:hypothetical protein
MNAMNIVVRHNNELVVVKINPIKGETNVEYAMRTIKDSVLFSKVVSLLTYRDNGKVNK